MSNGLQDPQVSGRSGCRSWNTDSPEINEGKEGDQEDDESHEEGDAHPAQPPLGAVVHILPEDVRRLAGLMEQDAVLLEEAVLFVLEVPEDGRLGVAVFKQKQGLVRLLFEGHECLIADLQLLLLFARRLVECRFQRHDLFVGVGKRLLEPLLLLRVLLLRYPDVQVLLLHEVMPLADQALDLPLVIPHKRNLVDQIAFIGDSANLLQNLLEVLLQQIAVLLVVLFQLPWEPVHLDREVAGRDLQVVVRLPLATHPPHLEPECVAQEDEQRHAIQGAKHRGHCLQLDFRPDKVDRPIFQCFSVWTIHVALTTSPDVADGHRAEDRFRQALSRQHCTQTVRHQQWSSQQ
mmetsp:Transcript_98911/g.275307  ORF Transcript_98911/g.275307 Transcript_98911/m.275307 type:complete len:348 (+) Transcript_98911:2060-3103(+)